jgi:DeoR/GlpR family transcriptional regulator of sugar metabolism
MNIAEQRLSKITAHLAERGRASVKELASLLETSGATVRRDLKRLADAGIVRRVHGAATLLDAATAAALPSDRDRMLARGVYASLEPGDVVALEGDAVMRALASLLAEKPLRLVVITNHLRVAQALQPRPGIEVIVIGGKLDTVGRTLPSPTGAGDLKFLVANKAFVEVDGLHPSAGATALLSENATFKHAILQHALHTTVVAPFEAWGSTFAHRVALPAEIERWITTSVPAAARASFGDIPFSVIESHA